MARTDYLGWLVTIVLAAILALLIMRPMVGERWFGLYGLASIAIPFAIAAGVLLARRYRAIGRSRWWALVFVLPVLLLAAAQIGFWSTFFSLGSKATLLVMMRAAILATVDPYLPAAAAVLFAALSWMLASAAREPSTR